MATGIRSSPHRSCGSVAVVHAVHLLWRTRGTRSANVITKVDEEAAIGELSDEAASTKSKLSTLERIARQIVKSRGVAASTAGEKLFWELIETLAASRVRDLDAKLRRVRMPTSHREAQAKADENEDWCDRCGRVIERGKPAARSERGRIRKTDGEFSVRYTLGVMHLRCYEEAAKCRDLIGARDVALVHRAQK